MLSVKWNVPIVALPVPHAGSAVPWRRLQSAGRWLHPAARIVLCVSPVGSHPITKEEKERHRDQREKESAWREEKTEKTLTERQVTHLKATGRTKEKRRAGFAGRTWLAGPLC